MRSNRLRTVCHAQTVFGQIIGPKFKPLGGHKDGGADGFVDSDIYEGVDKPTRFFQASKDLNIPTKIRATIARLREFKREVKQLYYTTQVP